MERFNCWDKQRTYCLLTGQDFESKWCLEERRCDCEFCKKVEDIVTARIEEALFSTTEKKGD